MTQMERLEQYLYEHNKINPLEALTKLGIYRLGAVIFMLKKRGMNIITNRKTLKNRFGEECNFAEYELVK